MADVLAGSGSAQTKEIDRSAISSSKLNRPDVQSQKVKRGLTTRPSSVEGKEFRGLENRPELREEKIAPSQLKKRPDASGFRVRALGLLNENKAFRERMYPQTMQFRW